VRIVPAVAGLLVVVPVPGYHLAHVTLIGAAETSVYETVGVVAIERLLKNRWNIRRFPWAAAATIVPATAASTTTALAAATTASTAG
jgi:hypothetical protein